MASLPEQAGCDWSPANTQPWLRVRRGRREDALSICLFGDYSTSCALFGCRDVPVNWTLRRVRNFGEAQRVRINKWEIPRSEEHTSELQSRQYLVCRLLLEKKK